MKAATALAGVMSERRYSLQPMPSRIFSLMKEGCARAPVRTSAMVVLLLAGGGRLRVLALLAALRERVEPHQQRGPEGHHEGRGAQRAGHEVRVRPLGDVRPEGQLLQLDVADVEPARAARLALAEHVVEVAIGVGVDARLGRLEELGPPPEGEGAGGARLGAGRLQ